MTGILLALFLSLLTMAHSALRVYMPECALQLYKDNNEIKYNLANFGRIPYGATIKGQLTLPKEQNKRMCTKPAQEKPIQDNLGSFLLIERGDCKFTRKIVQAQNLNHKLVIIYDNVSSSTPTIVMSNDGHGHLVEIPSMFISGQDGKKLKDTMKQCNNSLILMVQFQTFRSPIANVTFWLDPTHRESYVMLRDFYDTYYKYISNYINVSVKFNVKATCASCPQSDCLSSHAICFQKNPGHKAVDNGVQILKEQLRSYYVLTEARSLNKTQLWWQYMMKFDDLICIERKGIENCSNDIIESLNLDSKKISNMVNIQITMGKDSQSDTNRMDGVLTNFSKSAIQSDILYYPEATVNGRNFYGIFKAPEVFQMICQSLESPPHECVSFIQPDCQGDDCIPKSDMSTIWVIVVVLAVMTGTFVVLLIIYTKVIRRQVNMQLSVQVNRMVQNYVTLNEQKSQGGMKSDGGL